jgi:serine O-acetyltransferase
MWQWIVGILIVLGVLKIALIAFLFRHEIKAAMERDPAATRGLLVIFTYSGLHALIYHRLAHALYRAHLPILPRMFSQMARFMTGIEIHPAADIGRGFFIDHGMGVVIGETAKIGDQVTIYQGVTLGGTGKETGKRHPTIGNRVVIGAGAKVLGNIHVGDNAFIGANAVVVRNVPASSTVVGVPGRITSREGKRLPGINLDHSHLPDPLQRALEKLQHEIDHIEGEIKKQHGDR